MAADLVVQDPPAAIAAAVARPEAEARAALAPDAPATDGASYRVFPLPFESPTDGGRALVSG
jgi:hypothetical protein